LVIIDEASQCSLAAVLPLAYRAKRLAVVGDPCQLNPIVSVGDRLLQEIAAQTGFDTDDLCKRGIHHKSGSAYLAFEFAARPREPVLLNEHYRCHPHIARWFNRTFYDGELTVLTDVSGTSQRGRAIWWVDVDGEAVRPPTGSWLNRAEAEEAVRQLRGLIKSGYKTVGVVTPFSAQAQLIGQLARKQIGQDSLDTIKFVSGTAHRFQGGERDVILFASVLSPGMSESGPRWVEKERNLLNVAVSRASRVLIVLGHPLIGNLGSSTLASLRAYVRDEVNRNEGAGSASAEFRVDSMSEKILLEAMQLGDLLPYAKLEVEGYELDFALLEQGIKLNIEVDGDQHLDARGRQRRQDITRDRVLAKLGWTVLRIPAWQCHKEIEVVIDEIRKTRDRLLEASGARSTDTRG
jgi:very-short-patch-repair endonuclease